MTLEEIKERLQYIESISDDDEAAHGREDDLYEEFIRYVADNAPEPLSELAREVLKSKDITFERWVG
jgi:hypothetical protein